jgi:hypothetical protein
MNSAVDGFTWPYRTVEDVGPWGDSRQEMREVEQLIGGVIETEVYVGKYVGTWDRRDVPDGILAEPSAVEQLDDWV